MKKFFFANENDLLNFAARFAGFIAQPTVDQLIIFLEGPLGAGKTTFVRGFLRGLGYEQKVKSPTYTLVEPYLIHDKKIFHFDLYRINQLEELDHIGLEDYFQQSICLIEWAEKALTRLPGADLTLFFNYEQQGRAVQLKILSECGQKIVQDFE